MILSFYVREIWSNNIDIPEKGSTMLFSNVEFVSNLAKVAVCNHEMFMALRELDLWNNDVRLGAHFSRILDKIWIKLQGNTFLKKVSSYWE